MQDFSPEQAIWNIRREFGEHGGITPSISRSSTFTVMEPEIMPEIFEGKKGPDKGGFFLYSRHFNPTVDVLSKQLAAMEGTESAICTASGMAAISCTILQLCHQGDHLISSDTIYGGTHAFFEYVLPDSGIQCSFVDPTDLSAFEKAITPQTKAIYIETIGNPTLKVADIPALAKLAKEKGVILIVDNTFSPMQITPVYLGADIVIHSLTKFINGASDVIAGVVCSTKAFVGKLMDLHTGRVMLLGPTMDARVAYDVQQRLPHLPIRLKEHGRRALKISRTLEEMGVKVSYPGLESHPQHQLVHSMTNKGFGYGGILTVDCGTHKKADKLLSILQNKERFGYIAVSLGYYDTLMSCSSSSTSSEIPLCEQQEMGLTPGLVRLAVGFTGTLKARLEQIKRAVAEAGLV